MAHDVFISYSSKDKPVADAVCAGLEGRGIRCWAAPRDILPGSDWGAAIQAQFDVVAAQSFDPFTIQPREIAGQKQGSFSFSIHSSIPQQVTLKATLIDA